MNEDNEGICLKLKIFFYFLEIGLVIPQNIRNLNILRILCKCI